MIFIDRTGLKFGKLTVERLVKKGTKNYWECLCDCGNKTIVYSGKLSAGLTKSCGCLKHGVGEKRRIDRTGQRFGNLIVLNRAEGTKRTMFRCLCDCGNEIIANSANLANSHTRSCGCLVADKARENFTTHGLTNTPEHRVWMSFRNRCNNESDRQFKDYGGRGIKLCDRWQESFENFLEDMGKRPSTEYSIDRIDNDKGYSKDNCRWTTSKQQANNRRSSKLLTVDGVTRTLMECSEHYQISYSVIQNRLRLGWTPEQAVKTPVRPMTKTI